MGPSLHIWNEGTVKTINWKGKIGSKEGEDTFICKSKIYNLKTGCSLGPHSKLKTMLF